MATAKRICSIDGCDRDVVARGWCRRHYQRWKLKGDPGEAGLTRRWPAPETCTVDGCDKPYFASGYCEMHRWRVRQHGDPGPAKEIKSHRSTRTTAECEVEGCVRRAERIGMCHLHYERVRRTGEPGPAEPLYQPKGSGHVDKKGYRRIHVGSRRVLEQVHVMEQVLGRRLVPPENVHHKNGQRGDNSPGNLELWLKMQPSGQRVADLMEYIATYHADAMREILARKR